MKKLITLLFIISISTVNAQDIPKRASQIFILNDKTESENFIYVLKYLVSQDIEISKRDEELGSISTSLYSPSKTNPMMLMFYCQENFIRVSGNFKLGMRLSIWGVTAMDDLKKIENRGMKGSPLRRTFEAMNSVAYDLGDEFTYN